MSPERSSDAEEAELALLDVLSCYGPSVIPWPLFGASLRAVGREAETDEDYGALERAAGELAERSLLETGSTGVLMGRQERESLPGAMDPGRLVESSRAAMAALDSVFPEENEDPAHWLLAETLMDSIDHAFDRMINAGELNAVGARLATRVSEFLLNSGRFATVRSWAAISWAGAIDQLTVDDPELSRAHRVRGRTMLEVSDRPESAIEEMRRALDLDFRFRGPRHPDVASDHLLLSGALDQIDELDLALEAAAESVSILEQAEDRRDLGRARSQMGWILLRKERTSEALEAITTALSETTDQYGPGHLYAIEALNYLGVARLDLSDLAEARRLLERALELSIAFLGEEHEQAAIAHSNLGVALLELEDLDGATRHLERAIKLARQTYPAEHSVIEIRLRRLAQCQSKAGNHAAALDSLKSALKSVSATRGILDKSYGKTLLEIGHVHASLGDLRSAEEDFESGISVIAASNAHEPGLAEAFRDLGRIYVEQSRWLEAAGAYEHALEVDEHNDEDGFAVLDRVCAAYADLQLAKGRGSSVLVSDGVESEPDEFLFHEGDLLDRAFNEALELEDRRAQVNIAKYLSSVGDIGRATKLLGRGANPRGPGSASDGVLRTSGLAWRDVGEAHLHRGRVDAAIEAFETAVDRFSKETVRSVGLEVRVYKKIADACEAAGDGQRARSALEMAVQHSREGGKPAHVAYALTELGRFYQRMGDFEEASAAFQECIDIEGTGPGTDAYSTAVSLHDLAVVRFNQGDKEAAVELLGKSLSLKREAGQLPRDAVDIMVTSGTLSRALADVDLVDEAVSVIKETLSALDGEDERTTEARGMAYRQLGLLELKADDLKAAIDAFEIAVEAEQERLDQEQLIKSLRMLGRALERDLNLEDAQAAYAQQLILLESIGGLESFDVAETMVDLGDVHRKQWHFRKAAEHYESALALLDDDQDSPRRDSLFGRTLLNYGRSLRHLGELDEAFEILEKRLKLLERSEDEKPQREGVTLHDLGDVRREMGDLAGALELYERAAEKKRAADAGESNPRDFAVTLNALADVAEELGEVERAREVRSEAERLAAPTGG